MADDLLGGRKRDYGRVSLAQPGGEPAVRRARRFARYRLVKRPLWAEIDQYGSDRKVCLLITYLSRGFPLATLQERLLTPENAPHLIADTQALVDNELANKGGISGTALKAAYKAVTAFAPGYYQSAIGSMLPGMVHQLEPYWADFLASGGADFGDYLSKRPEEVSESLLAVTDEMAAHSGRATVVKAYKMVRGGASKNIPPALPAVGAMIQKYAA